MSKKLLLIAMLLFTAAAINAQRWDWDMDDEWWYEDSAPFLELNVGLGQPNHTLFSNDFSKTGTGEIKLGYRSYDSYYNDYVYEMRDRYFFVSNVSTELSNKEAISGELDTKLGRFGFSRRHSYGYDVAGFGVYPFTDRSYVWSRLEMVQYPAAPPEDIKILDRFNDALRFGTMVEGGVQVSFGHVISIGASYEAATIFPRFLVWKQIGSMAVEEAGYQMLDYFIERVIDSSPYAGPVINFLLKNGYSYAVYQLRKKDMSFPFQTEEPLNYETVKVGVTFSF